MKFRPHRGSLSEAMAEVVDLADKTALATHISSGLQDFGIALTEADIRVQPYGLDQRVGWDTHVVLMRNVEGPTGARYFGNDMPGDYFGAIGFTDSAC